MTLHDAIVTIDPKIGRPSVVVLFLQPDAARALTLQKEHEQASRFVRGFGEVQADVEAEANRLDALDPDFEHSRGHRHLVHIAVGTERE
jgi:hypothetical protein